MSARVNEALLRRPWVSAALALAVLVVFFGALPAGWFEENGPAWLTWAALGLMGYGAALAVAYPRIARRSPAEVYVVTYVSATAPALVGYAAAGFGAPHWVLSAGLLVAAICLAGVTRIVRATGRDG